MNAATNFSTHIKPYFTPCYRAHMIKGFDLWDYDSVKSRYNEIKTRVEDGSMPAPGCGEGEWDDQTRDQFLKDFQKWRDGNFTQ